MKRQTITEKLETAGNIIFGLGILSCIVLSLIFLASFENDAGANFYFFLAAIITLFQGWIISLIFKGFAAVLKLLGYLEQDVGQVRTLKANFAEVIRLLSNLESQGRITALSTITPIEPEKNKCQMPVAQATIEKEKPLQKEAPPGLLERSRIAFGILDM